MSEEDFPHLGPDERDRGVAILKGAAGFIPGAGTALGEIIGRFIPNQRIDRIEEYLRKLRKALNHLTEEQVRKRIQKPEAIDLFEEGGFQSARAITEDRRDQIANVVSFGLSGDEKDRIEAKRILKLLDDLDDDQIIILARYLHKNRDSADFDEKHQAVIRPVQAYIGAGQDVLDQATMNELARAQLISLGLLKANYRAPKKGELPDFDLKTGRMKYTHLALSPLGRLLLRRIGLAEADEF